MSMIQKHRPSSPCLHTHAPGANSSTAAARSSPSATGAGSALKKEMLRVKARRCSIWRSRGAERGGQCTQRRVTANRSQQGERTRVESSRVESSRTAAVPLNHSARARVRVHVCDPHIFFRSFVWMLEQDAHALVGRVDATSSGGRDGDAEAQRATARHTSATAAAAAMPTRRHCHGCTNGERAGAVRPQKSQRFFSRDCSAQSDTFGSAVQQPI